MAITNYAQLKTAIATWLNRADLTAQIPDFVVLAESRFNRELRTNDMIERKYTNTTSNYLTMPANWQQTRSIRVMSPNRYDALEYVAPEEFYDLTNDNMTGTPRYYSIIDQKVWLLPAPSEDIQLEQIFYATIPPLDDGDQNNWLLTKSPDLYLYASLNAAEAFLMNDERLTMWNAEADKIIIRMNYEAERARYPAGQLRAKKRTFG